FTAEAQRRRKLELFPEASTNEEPVLFRSSIIPWWAWLKRSYLPQAELLNGNSDLIILFTWVSINYWYELGLMLQVEQQC
ncbi:hypothetical protein LINPERPRIM_LOCUS36535, partial [Linum perenne]